MGTFILAASAISILKKPQIKKTSLLNLDKNDLLLDVISIDNNELTIYETLNLFIQQKISSDQIRQGLNDLQQKTSKCYYLALTPAGIESAILLDRREVPPKDILFLRSSDWQDEIENYESITLKILNKNYKVDRYFGECK